MNNKQKSEALYALGVNLNEADLDVITTALQDNDPKIRKAAVGALASFAFSINKDSQLVYEKLYEILQDKSASVRAAAVYNMGVIRGANITEGIKLALKDANAKVRLNAAKAIRITDGFEIDKLAGCISESLSKADKETRIELLYALIPYRYQDVAREIISRGFYDPDADVRAVAADILGADIENNIIEPVFTEAITNSDPRIRRYGIQIIGQKAYMGLTSVDGVYDLLIGYLGDDSEYIRTGAVDGLRGLGDKKALSFCTALFENDISPLVRRAALNAVCEMDGGNNTEWLLKGFHDPHHEVRRYAVNLIDFNPNIEVMEELISLLGDQDATVRVLSATRLNDMLIVAANDDKIAHDIRKTVIDSALESLLRLSEKETDGEVISAIHFEYLDDPMVINRLRELKKLGYKEAGDFLFALS